MKQYEFVTCLWPLAWASPLTSVFKASNLSSLNLPAKKLFKIYTEIYRVSNLSRKGIDNTKTFESGSVDGLKA